jgi:flavin-dependent dehydrogenase
MFDVIIIGAGPAGLGAAIQAAKEGLGVLVLERGAVSGFLSHPCGGAVAPLPGFVSGKKMDRGVRFPEIDLTVPNEIITGWPKTIRYISPRGFEMQAQFPDRDDFPVFVLDKSALLQQMTKRAQDYGATVHFDTKVTGLSINDDRVEGVRIGHKVRNAFLVIGAEGNSRAFTEQAGLYTGVPAVSQTTLIGYQSLRVPHITLADVGQLSTFGAKYTEAKSAIGTVDISKPGRVDVYFSIFKDCHKHGQRIPVMAYLEAYKMQDPRVTDYFIDASVMSESACQMRLRPIPQHVVADGFIGVGDSISPGGHLGIIPSIYLGYQAAEKAAAAIKNGDTSKVGLQEYDQLFNRGFLRGLEMEGKIMQGLANMTDEEIDRLCQNLGRVNIAPFFLGETGPMIKTSLQWLLRSFPLILRDYGLLRKIF